jgi:hypothetical protein
MPDKLIDSSAFGSARLSGTQLQNICHKTMRDIGWWDGVDVKNDLVIATKLLMCHSEISEATEAHRRDLMDDKLPHRKGVEVELADEVIRCFDLGGAMGLDIGGAIAEKLLYNQRRADHKPENRAKKHGKKY